MSIITDLFNQQSVEVRINGKKVIGWTHASITASMERIPRTFELGIILDVSNPMQNAMQQPLEIWLNHGGGKMDKVITGYIDVISDSLQESSHEMIYSGRGICCDLVDSNTEFFGSNELIGISAATAATKITAYYDIPVVIENPKANVPFKGVVPINIGDTAYTAIEYLARATTCVLYENANGALVLGAAGSEPASKQLITHQVAVRSTKHWDTTSVFGDYRIYAVPAFKDTTGVEGKEPPTGTAHDPTFDGRVTAINKKPRHRMYRKVENFILDPALYDAKLSPQQIYATYICNRLNGRSQVTTITVLGWTDKDGAMWVPNQLVYIMLPYQNLYSGSSPISLVVAEVTYSISPEEGTTTTMNLMPITAFGVEPISAGDPDQIKAREDANKNKPVVSDVLPPGATT
jgi:prophage tail gpP-like protein